MKIINSNGFCKYCNTKSIHYGVLNGKFTYECTKCNKKLTKDEVLIEAEIKRKQEIIDLLIESFKEDFSSGDYTVIDELLNKLNIDVLTESLPDKG